MCSHYISERRRAFYFKHYGIDLPADREAPRGSSHVYPTQLAPIVRRPAERESGDEAVPEFEAVMAHFGLLRAWAKDINYGRDTYNSRSSWRPSHEDMRSDVWISACAHRLQRRWPPQLEEVAADLWRDPHLRELAPAEAARE